MSGHRRTRGRGRPHSPRRPLPDVGRVIKYEKKNLSSLKDLSSLQDVCSKLVQIKKANKKPDEENKQMFVDAVFSGDECFEDMIGQWDDLFQTIPKPPSLYTLSPVFNDLVHHILSNSGKDLYRNGAVKMLIFLIMRLGSDENLAAPSYSRPYTVKISTTTDPTNDKCGLPEKVPPSKPEDTLNGKHATYTSCMHHTNIFFKHAPTGA